MAMTYVGHAMCVWARMFVSQAGVKEWMSRWT